MFGTVSIIPMRDNTIYVLSCNYNVVGIFTSRKQLRNGVDWWIRSKPGSNFYFQAFMKNYMPGDVTKKIWAYVSPNVVLPPLTKDNWLVQSGINIVGKTYKEDVEC